MLTIDSLRQFGANVSEGLGRCMNNEAFYLRLVRLSLADGNFDKLLRAAEQNDLDAAFEASHALKGVLANLALTPMSVPADELCEALRTRTPADYVPEARMLLELRDQLKAMDT